MAAFEFTAKHPMYLGAGNQIGRGERFTMNIHTMGVQPSTVFSTPESRRQAIQQFAVNGIDVKSREYLLNTGHWDIKRIPDRTFSKAIDIPSMPSFQDVKLPWNDVPNTKEVIDDVDMKKGCIETVRNFFNEGKDIDYADKGLEGRCEIVYSFYEEIKEHMGIDADLDFVHKPAIDLGGYNPNTNKIDLNVNFLERPNCDDLLNTVLHESRHAFQNKCIENPDSVTVKKNIIDVWKDNFENYISPGYDFEAYENQEIEKDANYFADSVMKKGTDINYG